MPRGRLERLWIGGGAAVGAVMMIIGYLLFISPQRSETADVDEAVSAAQLQNTLLQRKIDALSKQNESIASYQADLKKAQDALPASSGLPDFLRSLQSIGAATHADVTSLTMGNPTDVTNLTLDKPQEVTGSTKPAPTVPGTRIYSLPITAQVKGTVDQLDGFLDQLQSMQPRAVLISQVVESTATSSGTRTTGGMTALTVTMQAFVAPTGEIESSQLSEAAQK